MPLRLLLAGISVLACPIAVFAQPALDAEPTTPYQWNIVIQTRPHPLLTPAFRDGLRRDLLAALQPALSPLGTVEVFDLESVPPGDREPLWQEFLEKGFAALDAPRDLTGVKTHFLRIEVRDGVYHLESRQHDGFVGLASPVVRKQSTRAPELVGRTAGLMIDRDFGLAGTVEPIPGTVEQVMVRFRGGKLGPIDRFVKEGDIFAVSQITRTTRPAPPPVRSATGKIVAPPPGSVPPPALTPAVREYTLLRVAENPTDGVAKCTALTQYKNAIASGANIAGYRCLKLSTVTAPVSVRLVTGASGAASIPVANVRATDRGFQVPSDTRDFLDFRNGLYRSSRPLSGVACVTVALGETQSKQFPVPILGTEPVTLEFQVNAQAEEKAAFERAVLAVSSRAADARIGQAACFKAVADLIVAKKNSDALARARAGFEAADTGVKVLSDEVQQLKAQADKSPGSENLLNSVDQQLAAIRETNRQLADRIKDLEAVVAKANDPANVGREVQAQAINTRINLLLARGEVDEALAAYDQLVTLLDDTEVKSRRDKLAAEWKPKDDAHAKAREYMIKTWPALATITDLRDSLPQLRNAVDACKKAGDRYAFLRFLSILGGFPAKLAELIKDLDAGAAGDLKLLEDAKSIREVVGKLEQEIVEYLKKNP